MSEIEVGSKKGLRSLKAGINNAVKGLEESINNDLQSRLVEVK